MNKQLQCPKVITPESITIALEIAIQISIIKFLLKKSCLNFFVQWEKMFTIIIQDFKPLNFNFSNLLEDLVIIWNHLLTHTYIKHLVHTN